MIWNQEVKDWLIANMNEFRNVNGRLSIGKLDGAVEDKFGEPMNDGEFIKWTEESGVKSCDGIKRLKRRLAKHKSKPSRTVALVKNKRQPIQTTSTGNDIKIETSAGQTVNWRFDHPTKSNLETLEWSGKTYILLSDCLKLLSIK